MKTKYTGKINYKQKKEINKNVKLKKWNIGILEKWKMGTPTVSGSEYMKIENCGSKIIY